MNTAVPKTITITDPRKAIFQASGATILALALGAWFLVGWSTELIDMRFTSDEAFAAGKSEMRLAVEAHETRIEAQVGAIASTQAVQGTQIDTLVIDFAALVTSITLADAVDLYNNADEALYLHNRFEASDGVSRSSTKRRHELERRKVSAKEYRDCVLHEQPNCEALRPR